MEELQKYDIIEIIKSDSIHIIGAFHSMVDGEIILFVPPLIHHILKADVTNVSRLKRKDEYDTSKIDAFFKHSSFIFQKRYILHDVLQITFEDDTEIEAKITEIIDDCLALQLDTQDIIYINFNYKSSVPLGILEIKRKRLHDLDTEETENNYTVLSYNIDESKCRYTLDIQLNAIMQYLNFTKQYNGELYAQRYRELIETFPYGTLLPIDQTKLKWIIPITTAVATIANNETVKKSLTGSLMCYKKSLVINGDNNYTTVQQSLNSILHVFDTKYSHTSIQSYLLPETVILKFEPKTASKELETNWAKKIQNWVSYTTDDLLPIAGYSLLPQSSILFSKYYLPETLLTHKIHLNMLSAYHLFNINCDTSFKFIKDEYDNFIPSIDQLIRKPGYYSKNSNTTQPLPSCYSIYEFIQLLEPYSIHSNHIQYTHIPKIQNYIFKNIKTFLSRQPPTIEEPTTVLSKNEMYQKTYVSSTELYLHALYQDSANAYVLSLLTPREKIDPLQKDTDKQKETAYVIDPPEPTCELKDECTDTDERKDKLNKFALTTFNSSTVDHKNKIDVSLLEKKIKYNINQQLKYNNKFNELSSGFKSEERVPPTYELFQQLMTLPLTKRYTSLLQFLTKYTRLDKTTQLFVCNTSNLPLVPFIFKVFADTYLTDINEYNTKIFDYCRSSQQVFIEDGFYKEKYTGFSLAPIENVSSYDELIRSAQIETDELAAIEFTEDQTFIEKHIQITWREITYKPILPRNTMTAFINEMLSQYNITTKSTKISPNYLLSLVIYVFIQFDVPCDKIVDEIIKNKSITTIDIGLTANAKPFSFLSNVQKYAPLITKLCTILQSKYKKQKLDINTLRKMKRKRDKQKDKNENGNENSGTDDEADESQFMPYTDSNHPILNNIKASIQKYAPIHYSITGDFKRVNNSFIEPFNLPDSKTKSTRFEAYTCKHDFSPKPTIEFHFDITNPVIIEPKIYPELNEEYKTRESLDEIKRQLAQMQTIIQDLTRNSVNEIIKKFPPLYFANYIKNVLQFYANLQRDQYNSLQDDVIPITHVQLIAPSHRDTMDRVVANYYKDFIANEKWGNIFRENRNILEELKQPFTESTKIILIYYLYFLCRNLPKDCTQFVDVKLKTELNIPDYAEIKKKMSVRQSVERQNFVHTSRELSSIAKSLKMIIETDITKTSYNIAQFTSREEDALKADIPTGDDGNE